MFASQSWPRLGIVATFCLLTAPTFADEQVVAYVPNWGDLAHFSKTIDYDKLTRINLAFENPTDDEGNLSFHPENSSVIAEAHRRGVEVLVAIGGGSASEDPRMRTRYFELIAPSRRAGFVAKLAAYVSEHDLDGLDVDLEGPAIHDDYGPFLRDLFQALKPKGKLLTAALSQGYGGASVPSNAFASLDFVNVMAYDATGPWNPKEAGPHSSIELARRNVDYWTGRGLPASKIVLGVPFYGYGFGKAFRKHGYPYREIVEAHPGASRLDQVGETIWYNGIPTIEAKTSYALDRGLAGIMIWSLDQDAPGEASLLEAIRRVQRDRKRR